MTQELDKKITRILKREELVPNEGEMGGYSLCLPKPYSTDIKWAFTLFEEMPINSSIHKESGCYKVYFNMGNNHGQSPTLPEAICLGWLKWLEWKEDAK